MEVAFQISSPLAMETDAYHTPPNPSKSAYQTPPANAGLSVEKLMRLLEVGILSKEDVRQKIMEWKPTAKLAPVRQKYSSAAKLAPHSAPKLEPHSAPKLEPPAQKPKKRGRENECNGNQLPFYKRPRPGKPTATKATLRRFARNPTRRRFFLQCCDPQSLLWTTDAARIEHIDVMLLNAAAADAIDLVYKDNPAETRFVERQVILDAVTWQVRKDRQNWCGKQPKRIV